MFVDFLELLNQIKIFFGFHSILFFSVEFDLIEAVPFTSQIALSNLMPQWKMAKLSPSILITRTHTHTSHKHIVVVKWWCVVTACSHYGCAKGHFLNQNGESSNWNNSSQHGVWSDFHISSLNRIHISDLCYSHSFSQLIHNKNIKRFQTYIQRTHIITIESFIEILLYSFGLLFFLRNKINWNATQILWRVFISVPKSNMCFHFRISSTKSR